MIHLSPQINPNSRVLFLNLRIKQFVIFSLCILQLHLQTMVSGYYFYHQQQQQPYSSFINGPGSGSMVVGQGTQMMSQQADQQQQQQQQQQPQQHHQVVNQAPTHLDQQQEPPGQIHRELAVSTTRDSPIFRFHAIALNSTTVKLVWSLISGYHADYFDIEYGPIPDSTHVFSVSKLNGTARDYTLHQLQPDTHYQFELFSYQGDRAYKPQLAAVRTPAANYAPVNQMALINPNIMPFGVKAEAKSNSSIQLSWNEPERPVQFRNSIRVNAIRYYINPSLTSSLPTNDSGVQGNTNQQQPINSPQYHYLNVTNPRESRLIVQKLRPATEYAFAVKTAYYTPDMKKIFTQSGFSMDTLAKTFDIEPSAPRNFSIRIMPLTKEDLMNNKTSGTIEFSWLPPESPNGQLKGYLLLYSQDQNAPDDQWNRIDINGANIYSWQGGNIRPGYPYYFKIRAINQKGQSPDSDIRSYIMPVPPPTDKMINPPVPHQNLVLLLIVALILILFLVFLIVSKCCSCHEKPRKGSLNGHQNQKSGITNGSTLSGLDTSTNQGAKLSGFNQTGSSSTVVARVGTLARRRDTSMATCKPDFWAMDQSQEVKSNGSEKNQVVGDMNMAMVSIQRDSPQFATTQLAPTLPDYRFAAGQTHADQHHLLQQLQQQQSHYHPGQFVGSLAYDQMDNATASALMTLSKRQQQQLQKYQIQFATTGGPPTSMAGGGAMIQTQASSPHQQPPPPPPLGIEQQQQQSVYGSHQVPTSLGNTRSLRLHRPTLYDPVSGAFVQANEGGPPNYSSHNQQQQMHHPLLGGQHSLVGAHQFNNNNNSNTLQFHPHQTSTLLSRRSTNTLRSFQTSAGSATYGQFMGAGANSLGLQPQPPSTTNQFVPPPPPANSIALTQTAVTTGGPQAPQQLLQSHQAVINQLNNSTYPSLPLKHVSAVRPQVMSSLEDQIEMELAEKEQQQQDQQQTIKQ